MVYDNLFTRTFSKIFQVISRVRQNQNIIEAINNEKMKLNL